MSSEQMLNVLRIIQEALQNAVKHASARHIEVRLACESKALQVTIKDDGRGFNPEAAFCGSGLRNMRHRCKAIGGRLTIHSGDGGTKIECTFPLK